MSISGDQKKYRRVGLGGTFDHFHEGHEWFLHQAATLSEVLMVGITTNAMLTKKAYPESIESYEVREKSVATFLAAKGVKYQTVALTDIAGPTVSNSEIEAIILTSDSIKGGEQINILRQQNGLAALPLEVIPLRKGQSTETISSQSIRSGRCNRAGVSYSSIFDQQLTLAEKQRLAMREVQGELVQTPNPADLTRYLVGDFTLRRFLAEQERYAMAVIDGKEQRQIYHPLVIDQSAIDLIVVNPAGSITTMLAQGLTLALRQKLIHVFVDGEEDLAAVVLLLLLPLGSTIYYGQPDTGLVRWQVTEAA